ncbi:MAG TPA: EamA family transporter [Streptosporangiaceae bacterium]|nr:EamA family transporter [Streptosporangiaceae bacterium]
MSRRGWLLFAAMSVIWGLPYLFIKIADEGVSPPVLVFTRTALAAALLLPIALRRREVWLLLASWRWLVLFTLIEIVGPWLLLSSAERRLSSSLSGLLIAAVPIMGVVFARLTGDADRLTLTRCAGLLVGLGGVALLAGRATGGGAWPVTEVLLTAAGYAVGPLIASRKLGDLPKLGMTAVCLTFAAVVLAPGAIATLPHSVPPARVLGSLAVLAVVCTGLAFLGFFMLIAEVGPARATVITYVNPAVAVVLGVAVLGEPLTAAIVASFVLILTGSVLATRPETRPPQPAIVMDDAAGDEAAGDNAARAGAPPAEPARRP